MKRKMTFSLMLTLSLLLSLVSLPATAQAAPPQRFRADTGVVTPGFGQTMFITISPASLPSGQIKARIRWMIYGAQGCSGMPPVCRHMVVSQGATAIETLTADDALSFDVAGTGEGVRLLVESNSPDIHVVLVVFDTTTQRIVAMHDGLTTTPFD